MANLPRVALILTGGTIDSVGKDRLDLAWYIEAGKRLNDGELLEQLPELKGIAEIQEIPFRRLPSHALVDKDWLDLVRTIHKIFDEDKADGIVITHGTNTIEETAYFLNLVLKTDKPVVVVGSMRPSSAISADGYLNLVNAIKVAADPSSRGRGCLLVMNDTIFNGRDVTKNATYRVEAFQSRDLGPLGFADGDGKIVYYHTPVRKHTTATEFDVGNLESLPRVDMVRLLCRRRRHHDRSRSQGRRQRHRQRRHRRRPADPRGRCRLRQVFQRNRHAHVPVQPRRRRPRRTQPRPTTPRFRRRRQLAAMESAPAARSGVDENKQSRRDSKDDRYLLILPVTAVSAVT